MKRREYVLICTSIVLLVMLVILFFYSPLNRWKYNDHFHGHRTDSEFLFMMRDRLHLSDEQVVSIAAVFKEDEELRNSYRKKILLKMDELDAILGGPAFEESRVRKLLEEIDSFKREERILFMKKKLRFEKYLTPEQKKNLDDHMKNRMRKFRERLEPPDDRTPADD